MGMGEFNSDDHYIYYCGQESHRRNRVALIINSREGNGAPLQYSCLENPMDRGAWWAAVHRVTQSWTQLKLLSMHAKKQPTNISLFLHDSKQWM